MSINEDIAELLRRLNWLGPLTGAPSTADLYDPVQRGCVIRSLLSGAGPLASAHYALAQSLAYDIGALGITLMGGPSPSPLWGGPPADTDAPPEGVIVCGSKLVTLMASSEGGYDWSAFRVSPDGALALDPSVSAGGSGLFWGYAHSRQGMRELLHDLFDGLNVGRGAPIFFPCGVPGGVDESSVVGDLSISLGIGEADLASWVLAAGELSETRGAFCADERADRDPLLGLTETASRWGVLPRPDASSSAPAEGVVVCGRTLVSLEAYGEGGYDWTVFDVSDPLEPMVHGDASGWTPEIRQDATGFETMWRQLMEDYAPEDLATASPIVVSAWAFGGSTSDTVYREIADAIEIDEADVPDAVGLASAASLDGAGMSPRDGRDMEERLVSDGALWNPLTGEVLITDVSVADDGSDIIYGIMTANMTLPAARAAMAASGDDDFDVCVECLGSIPAPATGAPDRMGFVDWDDRHDFLACAAETAGWGTTSGARVAALAALVESCVPALGARRLGASPAAREPEPPVDARRGQRR